MRIKRTSDKMTELEIKQAKTINDLQEEIKLKKFDITKERQQISLLKRKIELTNLALKSAISELKEIEMNKDIKRLHYVILTLISTSKEGVAQNEE
jgi:hypothetical protein